MKRKLHYFGLLVIVCSVFVNTIYNDFVWDDFLFLVNNKTYLDFNLNSIWLSLANGVEYLPIRDMSYALDYAAWGNNPMGFHITNVMLYGITVVFVYLFASKTESFLYENQIICINKSIFIPFLTTV